jgi:hypothetical protein
MLAMRRVAQGGNAVAKLVARVVAPLSALVAIAMLVDLVSGPVTLVGTVIDGRISHRVRRLGLDYDLLVKSGDRDRWVDVSRNFFETTKNGDVVRLSLSPRFEFTRGVSRLGERNTILGWSGSSWLDWLIPIAGLIPLMVYWKRLDDEPKLYWSSAVVGLVYAVMGLVLLRGGR